MAPSTLSWLYLGAVLALLVLWILAVARTRHAVALEADEAVGWVWDRISPEARDRVGFERLIGLSEEIVRQVQDPSVATMESVDALAEALTERLLASNAVDLETVEPEDAFMVVVAHLEFARLRGLL